VELHDEDADYSQLHAAMERAGFSRSIRSSRNETLTLPRATYRLISDDDIKTVRRRAYNAALTVWPDVGVIVTEGRSVWINLRATPVETDIEDED
jgi:hypothetical protein